MKVIGIIAEFNPFHNGHEYLIKKAREEVGDPRAIVLVVMSGAISQRGEISILPKHVRAEQALRCGADVVLELPFSFACAPSGRFAAGAVELLMRTGVVTDIAFGIDSDDADLIKQISEINLNSPLYNELVSTYVEEGMSFPKARAQAIIETFDFGFPKEKVADCLHSSNTILAIDYLRNIKKSNKNVNVHMIKRVGEEYSSEALTEYASATAIRKCMYECSGTAEMMDKLSGKMPDASLALLVSALNKDGAKLPDKDLYAKYLINIINRETDLSKFAYMNDALSGFIANVTSKLRSDETNYDAYMAKLVTKHFTVPRVNRALASAALGQTADFIEEISHIPYIRVLGFNREGKYCLKIMGKCASIPIIHNCSDFWELRVDDRMKRLFEMDIAATNLRSMLVGEELYRSFKTPPVYVK